MDQIIRKGKGKGKDSGLKRRVDRREEKTGWKSEKIQFGRPKRNASLVSNPSWHFLGLMMEANNH